MALCLVYTAGSVVTIGLSRSRCLHSKNQFDKRKQDSLVQKFGRRWFLSALLAGCVNSITIDRVHDARHLSTRLRTDGIKAMSRGFSGGKQVINSYNTRNCSRVCLFLTTENEQLSILKTIMANYGWKWSLLLFFNAEATVDVLTASNNDVHFVEIQPYILRDH